MSFLLKVNLHHQLSCPENEVVREKHHQQSQQSVLSFLCDWDAMHENTPHLLRTAELTFLFSVIVTDKTNVSVFFAVTYGCQIWQIKIHGAQFNLDKQKKIIIL